MPHRCADYSLSCFIIRRRPGFVNPAGAKNPAGKNAAGQAQRPARRHSF
jgi:hypothetical protein